MIDFLGSIICRWKGHKWRRMTKKELDTGVIPGRICDRCGATRAVRARKAKPLPDPVHEANRTHYEGQDNTTKETV